MHVGIFAHKMLNDLFAIFATVAKEEDVSEKQHSHKQQGSGNNLKYLPFRSFVIHLYILNRTNLKNNCPGK